LIAVSCAPGGEDSNRDRRRWELKARPTLLIIHG
jgi:hypothetical protein